MYVCVGVGVVVACLSGSGCYVHPKKFGGRTTVTSLITSIQKLFKTMKSSLRYDSYKSALQILNPIDPEGKCEFEWPHTPNFEVNP